MVNQSRSFKMTIVIASLAILGATLAAYFYDHRAYDIDGIVDGDQMYSVCKRMLDDIEAGGLNAPAAEDALRVAIKKMQIGTPGFRRDGLSPFVTSSRSILAEVYGQIACRAVEARVESRPRFLRLLRDIRPFGDEEMMKTYNIYVKTFKIELSE